MLKLVFFATAIVATVAATDTEINSEEFVSQINSAQTLWQASQNEVTDKGYNYMKRLLGAKLPKEGENLNLPVVNTIAENIPESFDAREHWSRCPSISSIKNQGHCGSCWAVAAAGAASDRVCIHSGFHTRVNISAENLLSCCSTCVDPGTAGCDGGYPEKAWDFFHHSGLVTGGDYGTRDGCQPYLIQPSGDKNSNEYTPPCSKKCTNKRYGHSFNKDKHYGKTTYQVDENEAAIQTDILTNGPVEAAFTVYYDFMYYSSGIYVKSSSMKLGGHAVRLIGWGVERGVKYWLVANSWGRSWGENGTFRIRRGTNECEFESYIIAGLIKK